MRLGHRWPARRGRPARFETHDTNFENEKSGDRPFRTARRIIDTSTVKCRDIDTELDSLSPLPLTRSAGHFRAYYSLFAIFRRARDFSRPRLGWYATCTALR